MSIISQQPLKSHQMHVHVTTQTQTAVMGM